MKRQLLGIAALVAAVMIVPSGARAQSSNSVTVVQGLPGVTVDFVVDGTIALNALAPNSVGDLTAFGGQTLNNVAIVDDADGTVLYGPLNGLAVPTTGSSNFVIHLDSTGAPTLSFFDNDLNPAADGAARLTFRHVASAPTIDILVSGQVLVSSLTPGGTATLEQAAGTLQNIEVALPGQPSGTAVGSITVAEANGLVMYIVGSAVDSTISEVHETVALNATAATTTTVDPNATTTTVAATTTTTDPNATTTTTDPNATTTTTTTDPNATTTTIVPAGVNTGSPIDPTDSTTMLLLALAGIAVFGGAIAARRLI